MEVEGLDGGAVSVDGWVVVLDRLQEEKKGRRNRHFSLNYDYCKLPPIRHHYQRLVFIVLRRQKIHFNHHLVIRPNFITGYTRWHWE